MLNINSVGQMEEHVTSNTGTCISEESATDLTDDEEEEGIERNVSIHDGVVNLNTVVPPSDANKFENFGIFDGTPKCTKPEDQSGEASLQSRQTVASATETLWHSGLDLEQSSRGPPPPLVQQLVARWEHCDRDGKDAFERLVPPLSARSSVRRAHLSISTSTSAGGVATAMMPDVRVGLTPTEQTVTEFESFTAASLAIPICPPEALTGGALRAAPAAPNKCQVHQSHAQALPVARPPVCVCLGAPGRHCSQKHTALHSRTPLEELEEWRHYACPQALPHLDYLADSYRADARLTQSTGLPLASEKPALIQNPSAALGISLVALLLFPPLGLMAFALALTAMGLKRARRMQLADCLAFFSAKLTLVACSFGTVCSLILLIYVRYVLPQSNAPSTPVVGASLVVALNANARDSSSWLAGGAGSGTGSDKRGALSKLSPGIFGKPVDQEAQGSGWGIGHVPRQFQSTKRTCCSEIDGVEPLGLDQFPDTTPPREIKKADGPTRYVWPYSTHTPDDPMFDSDNMFPGKNMLVGKRMGAGFVRGNG